jgi:hypothetical protein
MTCPRLAQNPFTALGHLEEQSDLFKSLALEDGGWNVILDLDLLFVHAS